MSVTSSVDETVGPNSRSHGQVLRRLRRTVPLLLLLAALSPLLLAGKAGFTIAVVVLVFVGVKMLITYFHLHIPILISLAVVVGVLGLSVVASLIFPAEPEAAPPSGDRPPPPPLEEDEGLAS